jgi:hypothetical protein
MGAVKRASLGSGAADRGQHRQAAGAAWESIVEVSHLRPFNVRPRNGGSYSGHGGGDAADHVAPIR